MQERKRVADTAEPWSITSKLLELGWERQRLVSGDYKFFAHDFRKVGITRKTVSDLLSSIISRKDPYTGDAKKSFGQQLEEMLEFYDQKIILLEGSWKVIAEDDRLVSGRGVEPYTWSFVWNFLRTWQDRGFTIEITRSEEHTIRRLNQLYAYYQKPYRTGGAVRGVGDDRVLAFPVGCRGKTALKVLDQLGSLAAVASTPLDELLKIEDIGPTRGEKIIIHFHRDGRVEGDKNATTR